jgi:CDP-diacylglycerol---glycerol-3-phosphate 3-phosphatidyltransferase
MSNRATEPGTQGPVTEGVTKVPPTPEGHDVPRSAYGPSAVLTPANLITLLRFLGAPVFIAMILLWGANWGTFAFGGLLAFSDGIDGWVARRHGTTSSGAFLDPLADKVIVLGALYALVENGTLWWVPVTIIAVREVAMSVYRSVMSRRGISIPARRSAKVKTLLQDLAIGLCLAPPLTSYTGLLSGVLWVATALTVVTGVQYYLDGRRAAEHRPAGSGASASLGGAGSTG